MIATRTQLLYRIRDVCQCVGFIREFVKMCPFYLIFSVFLLRQVVSEESKQRYLQMANRAVRAQAGQGLIISELARGKCQFSLKLGIIFPPLESWSGAGSVGLLLL